MVDHIFTHQIPEPLVSVGPEEWPELILDTQGQTIARLAHMIVATFLLGKTYHASLALDVKRSRAKVAFKFATDSDHFHRFASRSIMHNIRGLVPIVKAVEATLGADTEWRFMSKVIAFTLTDTGFVTAPGAPQPTAEARLARFYALNNSDAPQVQNAVEQLRKAAGVTKSVTIPVHRTAPTEAIPRPKRTKTEPLSPAQESAARPTTITTRQPGVCRHHDCTEHKVPTHAWMSTEQCWALKNARAGTCKELTQHAWWPSVWKLSAETAPLTPALLAQIATSSRKA
jgi:hypothetical protein